MKQGALGRKGDRVRRKRSGSEMESPSEELVEDILTTKTWTSAVQQGMHAHK